MRLVQEALLLFYRAVRRTGVLNTGFGRALFEGAYWAYKSMLEARDVESLRPYVFPGSTVIDVGANIGFFSVRFARWVGTEGRVISVEPEARNFRSLCARLQRDGLATRVVPVQAAAIEFPGEVQLALNPDHPADHRVAAVGVAVRATTIDELVSTGRLSSISLIKIDVQGSELRVIHGAHQTIKRFAPAMYVEFDQCCLQQAGTSALELLRELMALGYTPNLLGGNGSWHKVTEFNLMSQMNNRGYLDVLLVHKERHMTF